MSVVSTKMLQAASASSTPNFILVVGGDYGTVGSNAGVFTYDYTDPENLVLMDHLPSSAASGINHARSAVFDKENMLLIISASNGNDTGWAFVVDVSDPYNLSLAASSQIASSYTNGYAQVGYRVGLDVANKKAYFAGSFGSTGAGEIIRLNYSSTSVSANFYANSYIDDPRAVNYDPVNNYVWVGIQDDNYIRVFNQTLSYVDYAISVTKPGDFFLDFDNSKIITTEIVSSGDVWELHGPISISPRPSKLDGLNPNPDVNPRNGFAVDTSNKEVFSSYGYSFSITSYASDNLTQRSVISSLPATYVGSSTAGVDLVNNLVVHGGRELSGATDNIAALSIFDISDRDNPTQTATYSRDDSVTANLTKVIFTDFYVNE